MVLKALALTAVLVLARPAARAADLPSYPFIHVNAQGVTYVMPDTGEVDFVVNVTDADPEKVRAAAEERIAAVNAVVTRFGVAPVDVEAQNLQRNMRKAEGAAPDGTPQYQIKCNVRIKVRTLASWSSIIDALLAMPNLDEFSTAFDTTEREKVEADLLEQALRNAHARAAGIAAGVGRRLGAAGGVTTGELRNVSRAMGMAAADFKAGPGVVVNNDPASLRSVTVMRFAQPVDVIYSLK
jgi:uncharacterized protein YggE